MLDASLILSYAGGYVLSKVGLPRQIQVLPDEESCLTGSFQSQYHDILDDFDDDKSLDEFILFRFLLWNATQIDNAFVRRQIDRTC